MKTNQSNETPLHNQRRYSYSAEYFHDLYAIEDKHFWFVARNHIIGHVITQIAGDLGGNYRVLEIGSGDGNTLRVLREHCPGGSVFGMDVFMEGLMYARNRTSCKLIQADLNHMPFREEFDVICLFDVLEHLADDVEALVKINEVLKPNGTIIVTVPAHRRFWSSYDKASGHFRRYETEELTRKFEESGYRVIYATAYMAVIVPFVWFVRKVGEMFYKQPMRVKSQEQIIRHQVTVVPVINNLLRFILIQEGRFIVRKKKLPFGTSLLIVAQKSN